MSGTTTTAEDGPPDEHGISGRARPRWLRPRTPGAPRRLEYGADYNPEQWSPQTWVEDVRLMGEAGVTVVSLGIFSWAALQPTADTWDFAWLDEVMDLLDEHDIRVDLATATASPPPWLTTRHPEILPVDREGHTLWAGARQHWRPTSPVFRAHALRLVEQMARRYGDHPALAAWHVNNELGCHNVYDYSDDAAAAFRVWLGERYGSVEGLNDAWATTFWSQRYSDLSEVLPPRRVTSHANPTQQLDFKRFSSDALVEHLRAERDVLHRHTPDVPVTTNFMVMGETQGMHYPQWAQEIDFVSNDHYLLPGRQGRDELSFSANLTGGIAGGAPWFLMEQATGAVNWREVNRTKDPGELRRDSLTHVAHGADAVCFFQWRQSRGGAEKYHSAMLPHAGEDSRIFRDVVALGQELACLAEVAGSHRVTAPVALVFDWTSWWAVELDSHPSSSVRYREQALDWYVTLLDLGVRVDVVPSTVDLTAYDVVLAPLLHVVDSALRERLERFVAGGGHLVTTYFSGVVDEHDHVYLGGYPGALRDLLGVRVEEFSPLADGDVVRLDDGGTGSVWSERVDVPDQSVEVWRRYVGGVLDGLPAVTSASRDGGRATYLSTRTDPATTRGVLTEVMSVSGVDSELPLALRGQVELAVRGHHDTEFHFVINRTDRPADLSDLHGSPVDLLEPHGVVVLTRRLSLTTKGSTDEQLTQTPARP